MLDSYEKVDMGGKAGSSLGKGAYGQVNLMCNKETNKYVALKVIEKKIVGNESMLSALQKEIEIHKKLQHDNIIRLCGHLEDESKIYLLMEYANKGNLFQLIRKKGRLTEKEAFFFFTQACSAINFLHRNMLMHRDIKPENLLLCDRGVLKLCDFGCCTQYDNQGRRTFCGTIEYMAPEIIKRGGYGEKADVWSLGILLFEMLHGYAPFHGKGDQDTISMIIGNKLKIGKDIKEDAKQLIEQILKDDPSQRPNVIEIFVYPWMKRMQSEFNIMDNVAPNSSPKKISSSEGKKQEISKNQKSEEAPQIHTNEEEKIIKKVKESTDKMKNLEEVQEIQKNPQKTQSPPKQEKEETKKKEKVTIVKKIRDSPNIKKNAKKPPVESPKGKKINIEDEGESPLSSPTNPEKLKVPKEIVESVQSGNDNIESKQLEYQNMLQKNEEDVCPGQESNFEREYVQEKINEQEKPPIPKKELNENALIEEQLKEPEVVREPEIKIVPDIEQMEIKEAKSDLKVNDKDENEHIRQEKPEDKKEEIDTDKDNKEEKNIEEKKEQPQDIIKEAMPIEEIKESTNAVQKDPEEENKIIIPKNELFGDEEETKQIPLIPNEQNDQKNEEGNQIKFADIDEDDKQFLEEKKLICADITEKQQVAQKRDTSHEDDLRVFDVKMEFDKNGNRTSQFKEWNFGPDGKEKQH